MLVCVLSFDWAYSASGAVLDLDSGTQSGSKLVETRAEPHLALFTGCSREAGVQLCLPDLNGSSWHYY